MKTPIITALFVTALGAVLALTFVMSVFLSESPQCWSSLVAAAMCWAAMRRSGAVGQRMFWWNCGALLVIWALFDLGVRLWMGPSVAAIVPRAALAIRLGAILPKQLNIRDPILGYGLAPLAHESESGLVYSTDSRGLRISPPAAAGDRRGCVLFFGCSYTFGEGVSDDQPFAYLVEVKTKGRYRTRNFGLSGSAPHYALGQLETGLVERAADCVPTHAIYLVLPHHLVRVSGKFAVRFGPRYALTPDGDLVGAGTLNRTNAEFVLDMLRYTSAVYVAIFGHDMRPADRGDIELTAAVLKRFHDRLLERFPGLQFHILYWNDEPGERKAIELGEKLGSLGVPAHDLSAAMPEIQEPASRAYLPADHHPSVWAHEKLADYVVGNILQAP